MPFSRSKPALWMAQHLLASCLALIGFMLVLGFVLVFRQQIAGIRQADKIAKLQQERQDKEQYLKKLDELGSQYEAFDAEDIERTRAMLPNEEDIPGILTMLEASAQASDVQLTAVNFAAGDTSGINVPGLRGLAISISVQHGNYQRFKLFLETLQDNLRLFDVKSANINPGSASYSLTLRAYVWPKS